MRWAWPAGAPPSRGLYFASAMNSAKFFTPVEGCATISKSEGDQRDDLRNRASIGTLIG
jgi:hypothetical protein